MNEQQKGEDAHRGTVVQPDMAGTNAGEEGHDAIVEPLDLALLAAVAR